MGLPSRRLRLTFLSVVLVSVGLLRLAQWSGAEQFFAPVPVPFSGRLEAGHGVTVEAVDLLDPPARLLIARVPRGQGLRVEAHLLEEERGGLRPLGEVAPGLGALVAINGDMHRLSGFAEGTTYSTLVERGRARVVGSPFSYACAFWLDRAGQPHVGRPDLHLDLSLPDGTTQPAFAELEDGGAWPTLVTRAGGAWSAPDQAGWSLTARGGTWEEGARFQLGTLLPPRAPRQGPALLFHPGPGSEALERLTPGGELTAKLAGADAARAWTVIGTGPRLLEAGQLAQALDEPADAGWTSRAGRTAIGLSDEALILAVTWKAPRQGLSLSTLARALRRLGCTDALNLDGGPSSALWAGGRVLNTGPGEDDPVASGLFVLAPAEGEPGLR